jgi:hypothetical protein
LKQTNRRKVLVRVLSYIVAVAIIASIVLTIVPSIFAAKNNSTVAGTTDTVTASDATDSNTSRQSGKSNDLTRYYTSAIAGSIEIGVIFLTPSSKDKNTLTFEIQLDNHIVDLAEYSNLNELAELDVDGVKINDGFKWNSDGSDGHHMAGTLSISNSYNGQPILSSSTKELKLILKDIEGVKESVFVYKGDTLK